MKLLLTSNGLSNDSIAEALFELTGKRPEDSVVVFIPTASNAEEGDKHWLINDLLNLKKYNFKSIEISDISAIDKSIWLPSFERADVLFFEGGNAYHLMRWLHKTGLPELLLELLKHKVYVGVSAGSMVVNPNLDLNIIQGLYNENKTESIQLDGLNFLNAYVLPHLHSKWFPNVTKENIEKIATNLTCPVYAIDDNSALKVIDGELEVISEGEWFKTNSIS